MNILEYILAGVVLLFIGFLAFVVSTLRDIAKIEHKDAKNWNKDGTRKDTDD